MYLFSRFHLNFQVLIWIFTQRPPQIHEKRVTKLFSEACANATLVARTLPPDTLLWVDPCSGFLVS